MDGFCTTIECDGRGCPEAFSQPPTAFPTAVSTLPISPYYRCPGASVNYDITFVRRPRSEHRHHTDLFFFFLFFFGVFGVGFALQASSPMKASQSTYTSSRVNALMFVVPFSPMGRPCRCEATFIIIIIIISFGLTDVLFS